MKRMLMLAALLSLTVAAPAAADSIAYVKGGNVYVASPDGSRHFQVTKSGGYSYVSQADDGTLIALAGRRIHRLDRQTGAVTADFATPVSASPAGAAFQFVGPIDPTISPDGKRIAYGYNAQYIRYDPYCGYYGGCYAGKLVVGTGYSHSNRLTGWDEPGFKQHSGWQWPSWIDSSRTLITDPAEVLNKQFWVDAVGDDQYGTAWFREDQGNPSSRDAEANRQLTGVAAVEGPGGNEKSIHVWKTTGAPPAEPVNCFYINLGESPGTLGSPSWSPSGNALTFEENGNVAVMRNLDLAGCDHTKATNDPGYLATGASSPDWGPAGVPAGAKGQGGPGGGKARGGKLAVKAPKRLRIGRSLRKGVLLTIETAGPGRVTLTARARGARVGAGSGTAGAAGKAKVRLRFTRKGARKLRKLKSVRLTVKVAFKPAEGGATRRRTAALLMRR